MTTLKALVDETTNIKNELITCHEKLKNNLTSNEILESNKLGDFIDNLEYHNSKINENLIEIRNML